MDATHKNFINQNLSALVDDTTYNTTCATLLVEKGVFGKDDLAHLAAIPNERERVLRFYQLVMEKADSFAHLITALELGCQSGAVNILKQVNSKVEFLSVHNKPGPSSSIAKSKHIKGFSTAAGNFEQHSLLSIRFDVLDPVRLFTGRIEELKQLHKIIQQKETKMASIVGLGGIGKTELARAYIERYADKYDKNLLWITSETEETLNESFRRLATDYLKLSTMNVDGKAKHITSIIDDVYNFFNGMRSLFVFDYAVNSEKIYKYLPLRVSHKPSLIITSRDRDWGFCGESLELLELDDQEAIELVKKGLQIDDNKQDKSIWKLVNELQCFPLAMYQAIYYIKEKQRLFNFSINEYRTLLESCSELLDLNRPVAEPNSYTKVTWTTWKATTDLISATEEIGSRAMEMLHIIAYFQPDKIPTKLLLSNNRGIHETIQRQNEDALGLLVKYSMVNIHTLQNTVSVHRLVQQVTRNQLQQNGIEEKTLRSAMKCFSGNIEQGFITHVCSVFKYCAAYKSLVLEFTDVPKNLLTTITTLGDSSSDLNIEVGLREILLQYINFELVDVTCLQKTVADLQSHLGHIDGFDSGLETLKRILPLHEENKSRLFYFDHIIEIQRGLALILKKLGREDKSMESLFLSHQILNKLKGLNDLLSLHVWVVITNCLIEMGHFNESAPLNREYLQILPEDLRTTDTQKIISVFKTAYENRNPLIGFQYSHTYVFYEVAKCLQNLGENDSASIIAREYYEAGKDSDDTKTQTISMNCLTLLANIKSKENKYEEAFSMFQEIHAFYSKELGNSHLVTLNIKRIILLTQSNLGQTELALTGLQELLKTMVSNFPDSLDSARVEFNIAHTLYQMKNYNDSLALLLDLKDKQTKLPQLEPLMSRVNSLIKQVEKYVDFPL